MEEQMQERKEMWCPACRKKTIFLQDADRKSRWICLTPGCYCGSGKEPKQNDVYKEAYERRQLKEAIK